jgi:hypothetical protein
MVPTEESLKKLRNCPVLTPTKIKLIDCRQSADMLREIRGQDKAKGQAKRMTVYVVEGSLSTSNLLSRIAAQTMGLIQVNLDEVG